MMSYSQWGNELYSGKRSYNIVGHRKQWLTAGVVLLILSAVLLIYPGLSASIEFKGGTEFSVSGLTTNDQSPARKVTDSHKETKNAKLSSLGSTGVRVQTPQLSTKDARQLHEELAKAYNTNPDNVAVTTIGPAWGSDVTNKAIQSLIIFALLVALTLSIYFRTWTMAFSALFALLHDTMFTAAAFALTQVEVSPATVIGVLTILGYSLYDTVVVFDKVRELTVDFTDQRRYTYAELVNLAVNQTMVRSINTSIVGVLPVAAIFFVSTFVLGGGTLRDISMALFIGMIVGTWSSIFIASPMLVTLRMREKKLKDHTRQVYIRRRHDEEGDDDEDSTLSKAKRRRKRREAEAAMEFSDDDARIAAPLKAGHHKGQKAQPTRKPRSQR